MSPVSLNTPKGAEKASTVNLFNVLKLLFYIRYDEYLHVLLYGNSRGVWHLLIHFIFVSTSSRTKNCLPSEKQFETTSENPIAGIHT